MFQFFVVNPDSEFTFVECEGATELEAMKLLAIRVIQQCYEAWVYDRGIFEQDVKEALDAENITTIQELMKSFQVEVFSAYDNQVSLKEFRTPGL